MEKQYLEKQLKELRDRIFGLEQGIIERNRNLSMKDDDLSPELEQENVDFALQRKLKREEILILDALSRINSGTYGLCVVCNEKINRKRIKALPYTLKCIDCSL